MASISALQQGETSFRCTIAVVALGSGAAKDNLALRVIRFLKHHGIKTVCYEDEARSWPLGVRFQSLLAGASWLLDSSQEGFARELEHLLTGLLQAEVSGRAAEDGLKSAMNRLGIVGDSHAMIAIFRSVLRVSQLSDLPIMIEGETGTGKELIARAIYQLDAKRCLGPFVAVNCGAISPSLAESELFGHRRGAFTGAEWGRKGLIRSAQGGVLFLDEIGEMDVGLQTKLLRVLQEGRVLGVGEDEDVPVNFRVIAATNRDLNRLVEQSKFRADLLHRLNVLTIRIPPLRERPGDLKSLVAHFLDKYQQLRPAASFAIGQEFIDALVHSPLFGNARQLENLVRWAIVNKDDDSALGLGDLPPEIWQWLSQQSAPSTASQPDSGQAEQSATSQELFPQIPSPLVDVFQRNEWCLSRSLDQCERWLLEAALERAQGNQSQMARMLGITPRSVYNKLRKHRLRG